MDDALSFLSDVDAINLRRRGSGSRRSPRTRSAAGVAGARIAVLGAAFKPQHDDVRDSPALDVALQLHRRGAHVVSYDPMAIGPAAARFPELAYADSAQAALATADLVVVATEWSEFTALDPSAAAAWVGASSLMTVIDGRNCLDADAWTAAGWQYVGLGRRQAVAMSARVA